MPQKRIHCSFQESRQFTSCFMSGKHHGEVIRAHACQLACVSEALRQPIRHLPQQRVAGGTAEAVVDVLETFQIDQTNGKLASALTALRMYCATRSRNRLRLASPVSSS